MGTRNCGWSLGEIKVRRARRDWRLFGAADVGRVFYSLMIRPDADDWHNGNGGGFWLSFLERRTTLSVAVMKGRDLTGVYLRAGLMF